MSRHGVHFDKTRDLELKMACQMVYEATRGTRESFIELIGYNYLD